MLGIWSLTWMSVYDVCIYCFGFECEYIQESLFTFRMSQLIGHILFTVLASASPLLCITVSTIKQVFDNRGLLASYGAKLIGAGLGRDT